MLIQGLTLIGLIGADDHERFRLAFLTGLCPPAIVCRVDKLSKERRSWNMSRIRAKNTKPERFVRSLLHRAGYRFRIHNARLPGRPDITLPKFRTVIFVHGCYWHRHEGCREATVPGTNSAYWMPKFERTIQRDRLNQAALREGGWNVIVLWECNIERETPADLLEWLRVKIARI